MRLKDGQDAFTADRPRCLERSADFCGVMSIIVHQQKAWTVVFDFEPATRVFELCQRLCNLFKCDIEMRRESNDSERILNIMLAGHIQYSFAQSQAPVMHTERR